MKALVIDSSELMRSLLRGILFRRGFEVADAATPREAMGHWQDVEVVLVEWDLRTPDVPAFISGVRRSWGAPSLFVVLASSEPERRSVLRGDMAGADHILVKPFTSAQLDSALLNGWFRWSSSWSLPVDRSPAAGPQLASMWSQSLQAVL